MIIVTIFTVISLLVFIASIALRFFKLECSSLACVVGAYVSILIAAWVGVDFSPSFTVVFLFVCIVAVYCGESINLFNTKEIPWLRIASIVLAAIGILFTIPSVYIYEVGDDWLKVYCGVSVVGGLAVSTIISFLQRKKRDKRLFIYIPERVELSVFSIAAVFTLLSGMTSLALIPYGLGLAILTVSRCFKNKFIRCSLVYCGAVFSVAFVWAPMVF